MEISNRNGSDNAVRSEGFDLGVESPKCDCHVRGMHGDTRIAHSENGVGATVTANCSAARTGDPLVTGHCRVVEVGAPGALQEIARRSCLVAQLPGSARNE